jgi:hypothetical protein
MQVRHGLTAETVIDALEDALLRMTRRGIKNSPTAVSSNAGPSDQFDNLTRLRPLE